ncbi:hypothetical protein Q7P37_002655 [Cladosporium fusiforme]
MSSSTEFLWQQGRSAVKRGDYTKALDHFNRAIGRQQSIRLYDDRAACFEALNDLPAALKDAKSAIKLAELDPTGYIRAGNILVKMDRKKNALEICDYALKKVKHVGQGFEVKRSNRDTSLRLRLTKPQTLKKLRGELMAELAPTRASDPLEAFPRETAEAVLSHLSFRQLINTSRVSKGWHQFITTSPNLWCHLDLSRARSKVRNAFVSRAINVGRAKLCTATLSQLWDFQKCFLAVARSCPLEQLTLLRTGVHSNQIVHTFTRLRHLRRLTLGAETQMDDRSMLDVLRTVARTLEEVHLEQRQLASPNAWLLALGAVQFSSLQILDISVAGSFGSHLDTFVQSLDGIMPNLHTLVLHERTPTATQGPLDFRRLGHLENLSLLCDIEFANHVKLPQTLKTFAIGTWRAEHEKFFHDDPAYEKLRWRLPYLEELKIGIVDIPFRSLDLVLKAHPHPDGTPPSLLRLLSMSKSDVKGDEALTSLSEPKPNGIRHPRLAALEELNLATCLDVCNETMSSVRENLPKLRSLNVSDTQVNGVGVKAVIESGNLQKLVANDCGHLGLDAVQWARSKGVKVEARNTTVMSSGRKVLYYGNQ